MRHWRLECINFWLLIHFDSVSKLLSEHQTQALYQGPLSFLEYLRLFHFSPETVHFCHRLRDINRLLL